MRPRGCSLLPRALDPPRRAGALGCRRAPRRLCLVALATPRPVCSSPRPNLTLGASRAPLSCSLRPNWPPQPAVGAAPAWMLHQAQLLLALCHACQHRACLLAPRGSQPPQSSVPTSLRHAGLSGRRLGVVCRAFCPGFVCVRGDDVARTRQLCLWPLSSEPAVCSGTS